MTGHPLARKLPHLVALTRLDRPIGIFLLLWPTLWALWFAAGGLPPADTLAIFVAGTVLTRSAGCAINDFADRNFDAHVSRTRERPLASGALAPREALVTAALLMLLAFALVLMTNRLTVALSVVALALASVYPFTKRITDFPQIVLGAAFAFAIPMAFAAVRGTVPPLAWALFLAAVVWAVAYDTLYAMADRDDDRRIGLRSTAILFGRADLLVVGVCQGVVLALLAAIGLHEGRGPFLAAGLLVAAVIAVRQLRLASDRAPAHCIAAFLDNNRLGAVVFVALALDFALVP